MRRIGSLTILLLAMLIAGRLLDPCALAETSRELVELAATPLIRDGEIICSVVADPAITYSFFVNLCTVSERGGGRRFLVEESAGNWVVESESRWLACKHSDPFRQVTLQAPIGVGLARSVLEYVIPQLNSGELVDRICVYEDTPPGGDKYAIEPIANSYSVRTRYRDSTGGRTFNYFAAPDSISELSVSVIMSP